MNRYETAMDFKNKFIEQNENVLKLTVKPSFVSINGDDVRISTNPYSMENAEHGLVIFHYTYIVIEREDCCMVPLFFNSNGEVEDYIEIDGWKLYFSKPLTAYYKCNTFECKMSNGPLKLSINIFPWELDDEFEKIWHLFSLVRTCKTQNEINLAQKVYQTEGEVLSLKEKSMGAEAKIDALNMLLDVHKDFIEKIKELVCTEAK